MPEGTGYGFIDELLRLGEVSKRLPSPAYDPSGGATISSGPAVSESARNRAVKSFQKERYGTGGAAGAFQAGDVGEGLLELGKGSAVAAGTAAGAGGLMGLVRMLMMKALRGEVPGASSPYGQSRGPKQPSPQELAEMEKVLRSDYAREAAAERVRMSRIEEFYRKNPGLRDDPAGAYKFWKE